MTVRIYDDISGGNKSSLIEIFEKSARFIIPRQTPFFYRVVTGASVARVWLPIGVYELERLQRSPMINDNPLQQVWLWTFRVIYITVTRYVVSLAAS